MQNGLERLVKFVYGKWKSDFHSKADVHPDEQAFACFLEGRLSKEEDELLKEHIVLCNDCSEKLALQITLRMEKENEVPEVLRAYAKDIFKTGERNVVLEISLLLKERLLEILHTTGDILVGQEFMPAPILRTRKIKDFKDEVTILKDFKNIRIEVKIENKEGQVFNVTIVAKEKETQKPIKDLRVTLLKQDLEMESYIADSGSVTFEHVLLGKYTIEISTLEEKFASIMLDVKI